MIRALAAWLAASLAVGTPALAQMTTTVGPNPQVLGGGTGGGHDHGYDVPPPPLHSLGGPFELTDQSGRTVTEKTFLGRWLLVYFGYAACESTCPTALQTMASAMEIMGEDAGAIDPAFVDFTVVYSRMHHKHAGHGAKLDPVSYAREIHPRLTMLTGTRRNMYGILRSFKVRQEHSPLAYGSKGDGLIIDHTTRIYLVGPDGRMVTYYYHTISPSDLANDLLLRIRS